MDEVTSQPETGRPVLWLALGMALADAKVLGALAQTTLPAGTPGPLEALHKGVLAKDRAAVAKALLGLGVVMADGQKATEAVLAHLLAETRRWAQLGLAHQIHSLARKLGPDEWKAEVKKLLGE